MDRLSDELRQLEARVPELEWQLNKFDGYFPFASLPKGLFRQQADKPGLAYAKEIREDLALLATYSQPPEHTSAARFLALKIQQKIHVLVSICKQNQKEDNNKGISYDISAITTRQEWLQKLETQVDDLRRQRQALLEMLSQKEAAKDTNSELGLRKELGDLEKRVTLAEEAYVKATQ
jgi:hypothetical protein